ncbi:serine hydrolase [Stenotrophomonas sp. 24(2023)]|uniref:serine hydrolase domain-containing protein n=1 Tax=Stenotrophomonas sp. 24(2023) TaxID=3068324 RepID=UPI0027E0E236|nr:serine hydrolase [Stenotrophomonas sp. 24(2023)]WMJ71336.1 serine hydrolase [Stenotrophomonas sp. 24(2023)]
MDSAELANAFDYVRDHHTPIHSLTIVRNGHVVVDAYFWPFQQGQSHDVASVTKSVTSTLTGIAIGKHALELQQPLTSVFARQKIANLDERKRRMTIAHLLAMSSGLDCDGGHGEITLSQMRQSTDWARFMLDLPMRDEPGSRFEYCSGGMHLLSAAITQATGKSALDYARRELFGPLGIRDVAWPADGQGVSYGWGDLHLQPLDMARLGYLWLNEGRWEDRQLVPKAWMRAAVQPQSQPEGGDEKYGYGLWLQPDRRPSLFEANGRGGQRISVSPEKNIVVVFTGGEFEPGDVGAFILRALKSDQPLPENPSATARLAAAVADAATPPHPVSFLPPRARTISGRRYTLADNPLGLKSFVLTFSGTDVAQLQLTLANRHDPARPIGLDGVPRVSPGGNFGLPVAVGGRWESDSTFLIDYNEVGNINAYRFQLTFTGNDVDVELSERSRVIQDTRVHGTSAD